MAEGCSREVLNQIKSLVEEEVSHTLGAITSSIALATSKTFLSVHLLNKDGEGLVEAMPSDGQVHNVGFPQCP
jgi:hypothetical protein